MPTWSSFASFYADLAQVGEELTGPEKRKITRDMAERGQRIAARHASGDLGGDPRFSGWRGRSLDDMKIRPGRDDVHWLFPTRKSGGPWKVAEQGRNQGDVRGRGGIQIFIGPNIDRRSGETYRTASGRIRNTRSRRSGRWNGYTRGKRTASEALASMESEIPPVVYKRVLAVQRKRFDVTG